MQETPLTSKRFTLVEREEYRVDLEYNNDFIILHLPWVAEFSKKILLDMMNTFEGLKSFLETVGYSRIHVGIPHKHGSTKHLAEHLGFTHIGESQGFEIFELWIGEKV